MLRILSRKARNSLSYRMCKRWDTPKLAHHGQPPLHTDIRLPALLLGMIRHAEILRGGGPLLLPPVAENVLRGAIEEILFAQVDPLRGQVGHRPQAHFAGSQHLARVHVLTPE